ncbi:hypothetical protein TVAG_497130 [Trichomonas vaginalis G3]|uniref:Spt20-like SEP domain-containing protein n=1 Tax=Trichomonas vaginalis (strain ATCC PRA-98 / G3) TaxID=412133 RepID=A2EGV6_TRIV3|nr:hypothetical protein TVAGG3_0803710 [Trichomonas vaginalis G3]EAY08090.1 hypothetical protein TVAG_497130 [Trichomonas vaginalis G3]KAI5496695.1 hypothetical protein TVAGG3_0803710 [Trichomonas vaginalis G3]|eukprot:XP_001320313.1 hypothetical protein [Trichomonas vaginalis G3]
MTQRVSLETQTEPQLLPQYKSSFSKVTTEPMDEISGKGPVLIDQYQEVIKDYVSKLDMSHLSAYRREICECIQLRQQFQNKVYGNTDADVEKLPVSIFSGLTPSLTITFDQDVFSIVSASGGLEITGDISSEGQYLIYDINRGVLPKTLYEAVKKLGLTWYDGGLICEVVDRRRNIEKFRRVHLKVDQSSLEPMSIEREQELLLCRYPLLCLTPDLQVTNFARTIAADAARWTAPEEQEDAARIAEYVYPDKYIEAAKPQPIESTEETRAKILKYLSGSK